MNNTFQLPIHLPWNERIWRQLTERNSIPAALLLFGKNGLGKQALAIEYSHELLTLERQNSDARIFLSGNHPDFHVLMPSAETKTILENAEHESIITNEDQMLASYSLRYTDKNKTNKIVTVEQIRKLIEQINSHAQTGSHKVVLFKSTDKMSISAANALLKTLEEPPKKTTFILIANQLEKLPITIRSRCIGFHFRTPNKEFGLQWLTTQGVTQNAESYLMMASKSPLFAQKLAAENSIQQLRDIFSSINQLFKGDLSATELALKWKKHDLSEILEYLHKLLVDIIKLKLVQQRDNIKQQSLANLTDITELFFPVQLSWSEKIARNIDMNSLFTTFDQLAHIKKLIDSPVDQQLLMENMAISFAKLTQRRL